MNECLPCALVGVLREVTPLLDPNSAAFARRVYETPQARYRARLDAAGLIGGEAVLDAGCGFGQWSLILGERYTRVTALDVASARLMVLEKVAKALDREGITPLYGTLDTLPLPDRSLDGVFCYQALFLSDWKRALGEFYRVLKPGGRLYFNANGLGWYVHAWQSRPNAASNHDPRQSAARALSQSLAAERGPVDGPVIIEPEAALAHLATLGFVDVQWGGDGTIDIAGGSPEPFFAASYYGLTGVYEVVAQRP